MSSRCELGTDTKYALIANDRHEPYILMYMLYICSLAWDETLETLSGTHGNTCTTLTMDQIVVFIEDNAILVMLEP